MRIERGLVAIERRTIWADDFLVLAHIKKNVRMIVGRCRPDAHEFPGADLDHWDARIVVKVGDNVFRHQKFLVLPRFVRRSSGGTIAGAPDDA